MKDYSYSNLKKLIEDAEKYRDDEFLPSANRNLGWLIRKYTDYDNKKLDYSVNLVYSTMKTMRTALYQKTPDFSFNVNGGDLDMQSITEPQNITPNALLGKALELSTKMILKRIKLDKVNRRIMTDAIVCGYGASKIGYKLSIDDELSKKFRDRDEKGVNIEDIAISDIIKSDHPFITRIDPRNLLFPAGCDDFSDIPWVCHIAYVDKKDVEAMFGVKDLVKNVPSNTKTHKVTDAFSDQVKVYEFHSYDDIEPRIITMVDGYRGIIQNKPYPVKDQDGTPKRLIKILSFNDAIDTIYPLSDIDLCEDQFEEANIQIDRRVKNAKRFIDAYLAAGNLSEEDIRKFIEGEDGVVLTTPDHKSTISPIEKPRTSQDFYQNIALIQQEILTVLGLTDYEVGGRTQDRKATEANIMQSSSLKRLSDRITIIDDYIYDQIDTLIETIKEHQAADKIFKLTVDNENIRFVLSDKLLKMTDYSISVVSGSTVELDKRMQSEMATKFIQASQAFGMVANMPEVYKEVLRMIGITNTDRFVLSQQPQPTPMPGTDIGGNMPQQGMPPAIQQQNGGLPQ